MTDLDDIDGALRTGAAPPAQDDRPVMFIAITTTVDDTARPPEIIVHVVSSWLKESSNRIAIGTSTEATLVTLAASFRRLPGPSRVVVGVTDPFVAGVLRMGSRPPAWLRPLVRVIRDVQKVGGHSIKSVRTYTDDELELR